MLRQASKISVPIFKLPTVRSLQAVPILLRFNIPNRVNFPSQRYLIHSLHKPQMAAETNGTQAPKPVLFFDIDNCLYPRSKSRALTSHDEPPNSLTLPQDSNVQELMSELIDDYFVKHLSISRADAIKLHKEYYTGYGLAIEGLVRHHKLDPLEYNAQVDDALPLEDIIKPNPELRKLIEDIDKTKVTVWLFTNAYVNHGKRVVKLLGIDDLFDGLTYCNYAQVPFVCKPHADSYAKAMKEAGVEKPEDCYFVDDSYANCRNAKAVGWTAAHLVEEGMSSPRTPASQYQISHLRELRNIYPQFFKSE